MPGAHCAIARTVSVVAAALALIGCYSPSIRDCSIGCSADGDCPADTTCGADRFCHLDLAVRCPVVVDGAPAPDGPRVADAPLAPDGSTRPPDASPLPPDAPASLPDARVCSNTTGEPDDNCPGFRTATLREGRTLRIVDHHIYPVGDIDVYEVPVEFTSACSLGRPQNYAYMVKLSAPAGRGLRLRRFVDDRLCLGGTESAGTAYCQEFTRGCLLPNPIGNLHFKVDTESGTELCEPYAVDVVLCAAGSTCSDCKQLQ